MKHNNDTSIKKAVTAKRESKYLDFKKKFDPNRAEDWCEIIKDIVAMANSGGGIIIVGVNNDGSPSKEDISGILGIDHAQIIDKIARYTGEQFDNLTVHEETKEGYKIAIMQIEDVSIPMIFIKPGTYDAGEGKQKTAFSRGSVYFRHGAKSEPGNSKDLRESMEREIELVKKSWLGNIRRVVTAPAGYEVKLLPPEIMESGLSSATPIRIVDDPLAPAYKKIWDDSPYQFPQEIVIGAVKSWRRDKTSYASEADVWTLYSCRNDIKLDKEKAECLLESAINRHAPFFFWARLLPSSALEDFIKRIAKDEKYPAPNMAAKLAYAIGGKIGTELLDYIAINCSYPSVRKTTNGLKKNISHNNRLKMLYGAKVKLETQSIDLGKKGKSDIENILNAAIKENAKSEVRRLDAIFYGIDLQQK